jgi:hypothetical protein
LEDRRPLVGYVPLPNDESIRSTSGIFAKAPPSILVQLPLVSKKAKNVPEVLLATIIAAGNVISGDVVPDWRTRS